MLYLYSRSYSSPCPQKYHSLSFKQFSVMAAQSEKPRHFNDWPNTQGASTLLLCLIHTLSEEHSLMLHMKKDHPEILRLSAAFLHMLPASSSEPAWVLDRFTPTETPPSPSITGLTIWPRCTASRFMHRMRSMRMLG